MLRILRSSALLATCFLLGFAHSQASKSGVELHQAYGAAQKLYGQKRFTEAVAILEPFYAPGPERIGSFWYTAMYDLACEEALAGRHEMAMEVLIASQSNGGSTSSAHLAADPDLASLHSDSRFVRLVDETKSRERLWLQEPGQQTPYAADLSEDAKVAGLSTFWAEARFNFAFFDRQPGLDWNELYMEYLPKVRATTSTEAYYRVLMRFAAELKDGHTNAYPPDALDNDFYAGPGLRTALVENKVVVTDVYDPALQEQGWRVGDVLQRIGGEDIHAYAEREIAPFQSSSTPQDLAVRTYGFSLLNGKAGTKVTISVEDTAGRQAVRTLTRLSVSERSRLRHIDAAAFSIRPDGVAVLVINEFEDSKGTQMLLDNLSKANASKGLIIDVRANGGGNTPIDLLRILANSSFPGALARTRSYRAVDRAWGVLPGWSDLPAEEIPVDKDRHIAVPVAVLVSARTFSAAEDFVAAFAAMHRGATIGEPTAGSTGQPLAFQLPGGGSGRVCTKNDRAGDGIVFEGKGLEPQIPVVTTLSSVRSRQDVQMERAAAVLLGSKRS